MPEFLGICFIVTAGVYSGRKKVEKSTAKEEK